MEEIEEEQETICEMCGTKFVGTGGVCSQECAEQWVKVHIEGPWNLDRLIIEEC